MLFIALRHCWCVLCPLTDKQGTSAWFKCHSDRVNNKLHEVIPEVLNHFPWKPLLHQLSLHSRGWNSRCLWLLVTLCHNSKGDKAKRVSFISSSQTPPFRGGRLVMSSKVDLSNGPCLSKSVCLSLLVLMNIWFISSLGLLLTKLLWTFVYKPFWWCMFSFLLRKRYLRVEMRDHEVGVLLTSSKSVKLFSKVQMHHCTFPPTVCLFLCILSIFTLTFSLVILMGVR